MESVNSDNVNVDRRCTALTKRGTPCRAAATDGGLCFFHANPSKAAELGRIGGRSKSYSINENADPLPTLNSALAVREAVARLIAEVYAGKLHPRIAAGLAPLMNLQLRAIEATELEHRLAKLQEQLAEAEKGFDSKLSLAESQARFNANRDAQQKS